MPTHSSDILLVGLLRVGCDSSSLSQMSHARLLGTRRQWPPTSEHRGRWLLGQRLFARTWDKGRFGCHGDGFGRIGCVDRGALWDSKQEKQWLVAPSSALLYNLWIKLRHCIYGDEFKLCPLWCSDELHNIILVGIPELVEVTNLISFSYSLRHHWSLLTCYFLFFQECQTNFQKKTVESSEKFLQINFLLTHIWIMNRFAYSWPKPQQIWLI